MKRASARKAYRTVSTQPVGVLKIAAAVPIWQTLLFTAAALVLAIWAYSPALNGPLVFDDLHLPMFQQGAMSAPIRTFLSVRPLLMLTYAANLHLSGQETFTYHLFNFVFHLAASTLLYFVVRRILQLALVEDPQRAVLSAICAVIFLLHPMQTEAVSYIAQRGESMGAMFFFAAWCLFLYRKQGSVSWPVSLGVLALYGAAVSTKEHTVTLPAVLLLTDWFFHPVTPGWAGIRSNWRLYGPLAIGGAVVAIFVARLIGRDTGSIGFNLKEFTWYQYLFTEWRVFFVYLGLFLLPVWQTIDYDFSISRSPFDHGAVFAFAAIVLLVAAALYFRKRFPLAAFGFLLFVLMLLPTSSVIPIKDVIADRRLYLPMTGLLFVCAELLRRFRYNRILACVLMLVLASGTFVRNHVWASTLNLWEDAAEKSPNKQRVQFGLAVAQFQAGRCHDALQHYQRAAELQKPDYTVLMDWSLALDCDHQPEQALLKMKESLRDKPTAQAWTSLGYLYARQGKAEEALKSFYNAQLVDSSYSTIYQYRYRVYAAMNRIPEAMEDLRVLLLLNPQDQNARVAMAQLKGQAH